MICRRCKGEGWCYRGLTATACPDCGGHGRLHGPQPEESAQTSHEDIDALYRDVGGEGGAS